MLREWRKGVIMFCTGEVVDGLRERVVKEDRRRGGVIVT